MQVPGDWPRSEEEYDPNIPLQDPKKIPQANGWRTVNFPTEIAFFIQLRNKKHFGQAENEQTPLTLPSMQTKFNWEASTAESELVLEGQFSNHELTSITSLFIDNLTQATDLDSLPQHLTVSDMRGKFKIWCKGTSTSLSGHHHSHYKLLFQPIDNRMEPQDRTKFKEMQEDIALLYCDLISYAITHRYSFQRWKQIVNTMILKEENNI